MATRVSDIDASEVAVEVPRTWRSEEAGKEDADWWKWVQRVRDLVPVGWPARFELQRL